MKVTGELCGGGGVAGSGSADPIAAAIADLRVVDGAIARVLRVVAQQGPVEGLPAWRLLSLATSGTSWDARFLLTCTEVLAGMPITWQAFDDGLVSWGQVRGIVNAAKPLSVVDRATLDRSLSGAIAQNAEAEPDRLVDVASDLAARLADARLADRETAQSRQSGLRLTPQLFGGIGITGYLDELWGSDVAAAIADATPPACTAPPVDDDGKVVPGSWTAPEGVEHRQAIALWRLARTHLYGGPPSDDDAAASTDSTDREDASGGAVDAGRADRAVGVRLTGRRPGRMAAVIVDVSMLSDDDRSAGVPAVTARQLWATAAGRTPLSSARVSYLTCDAMRTPVLTDGERILAVADAYDPVPTAVRRAVIIRDQGCRFPGCDRPVADTDLHHIIFQRHGGKSAVWQCVLLCAFCHNLVHKDGWDLTLYVDGRLVVRRGRWRFTSRPRLRPPPPSASLDNAPPVPTGHDGHAEHPDDDVPQPVGDLRAGLDDDRVHPTLPF